MVLVAATKFLENLGMPTAPVSDKGDSRKLAKTQRRRAARRSPERRGCLSPSAPPMLRSQPALVVAFYALEFCLLCVALLEAAPGFFAVRVVATSIALLGVSGVSRDREDRRRQERRRDQA